MPWVSVSLELVKFLGVMTTAGFGILGLLTEYKDKATNKITRWGKYALAGIIIGAGLTVLGQVLEIERKRSQDEADAKKALLAIQRAEVTLDEIRHARQPLQDIRISFFAEPPNIPEVRIYQDRLAEGVNSFLGNKPVANKDFFVSQWSVPV